MAITRRADYAVRMMYELAQLPEGTWLSTRDLCEAADIPISFGAPLVKYLTDAGLVRASGSREYLLALAMPASELTMAQVIRVADPDFSLSSCTVEPDSCDRSRHCGVHEMWQDLDGVLWQRLEAITLEQVVARRLPRPELTRAGQSTLVAGALGLT